MSRPPAPDRLPRSDRSLIRCGAGFYKGRGVAYGFVVERDPDDLLTWVIRPDWGTDIPAKAEYAAWIIENYMGLRGPHPRLRDARRVLVSALLDDVAGLVGPTPSLMSSYRVEYTPGPPAIGTATARVVRAWDANQAAEKIKSADSWVMIHRVTEVR